MSLSRQLVDLRVGQGSGENVGDVEIARTFGPDLEKYRRIEGAEALGLEVVFTESAKVPKRGSGVGETLRSLRLVGHIGALGGRDEEVVPDLVPARAEEQIRGLGAEPPAIPAVAILAIVLLRDG